MRALVFLSVFVACASANSLLGSKACTWGPSYWCSHVKHARECQATTHCLQTVWKYQILKQTSNTEGCTFCQLIVSGIKDMLAKKEVEVDVSKALSEICKLLPNPDWQDQCSGIVQEYTPELIEMIEKDISADMVCATIGLCQGLEDTYSPYGQVATEDKVKSDCDDCKKFFQDVQKSVTSNETLDQLEQLINQTICSQLEALESTCNELVAEFLPQVLQFIADQIDPNIVCAVFGFCSTADHKTEIKHADIFKQIAKLSLGNGSSEECEICKDVLNQVVEMLQDKIIQEKVQDFLENQVCVNFGGFAVRCQELVQEYVPMAFEYLVNALDPKTFCETVGMCVTPSLQKSNIFDGTQQAQTVQAMKLVPAQEVVTTQQVKEVSSSLTCEICETVMGVVDAYLKDNRTVATVEDLIFEVCDRLSSKDLTAQCRQFVQMYGKMVLDLLADDLDPKKVCSALSLCSASFLDQIPDELKTTTCDLCIEVITLIENSLQNVSTKEIIADLEALCTYLPGNYSKLCAMYVEKYGSLIISLLKSKEDPKSICALGKLCSIPPSHKPIMTVPIPEQLPASAVPSIECEVCDTVLIVMKEYLGNNATEEEIKDLLEKICAYVPSAFTAQCQALVEEYGDDIVKFFLQQLQPHQICMELGLCTEARSAKIPQMPEIMKPMDTLPILETQSKQTSTVPSIECEVCDTVLIVMKEYLGNNATEDEIKQLLKTICTYVPSALTSECQALVDQYGDDIVKFLLQELQPHQICIELGLCTEGKSAKILQMSELMKPVDRLPILETQSNQGRQGTVECDDCTTIVTEVIRFIGQNKTQMEIEMALKEVCGQMPSTIATACQYLVDQYTQELINLLLLQLVPTVICQKLHLCPITMVKPLPHPVHIKLLKDNSGLKSAVEAGPTCVLCEFAMKELDNILQQNRSREAIKEALDRLCGMLPSSLSEECQSFVNEYSDEVIEMLIAGLNPQEICAKLGLCTADMLAKSAAVVHLLKEEPGLTSTVGAGTSCELCEHAMGYLDSILQQNRSKEAIKEAVERLCDMMPTSLTDECHSFVTEYGDEVIELLIAGLNPQEICAKLRLCSADMLAKSAAVVHLLKEEPGVKAGPACIICEFVLKELDMILKENSSEAEIKAALGKVCSLFPDTISAECLAFVNQYSDLIITELVNGLDPQKVCAAINLCSAKYSTSIKPMKATAGPVCVLCEFALKEIDNFLQGNTSQAAVEKALDRLCALLPDTISLECQNFVKMYGPQIIQLLVAGINPEKICKEVGLCTFQLKLQDNDAYCEMCKDFVAVIKEMSEQNKTTAEIEKFLKSLCDKLPDTVTVQCHTYIQSKVPDILKWLDEQLDPEQVCQKLQLCPGTTKAVADDTRLFFKPRDQRQLLGTNECTYGPAFWCASEENAKKCNAIIHCQNHVWNN